jgi:hypothetical protein
LGEFTSLSDFARACSIEPGTLRTQLNRDSLPRDAARAYAKKLKVPLEWLLYGDGPDPFQGRSLAPAGEDVFVAPTGTLKNETAIAVEAAQHLAKLAGLNLSADQRGELIEDTRDLLKKYKS